MSRKTKEQFEKEIENQVSNEFIVLGEYINSHTNIKFKHVYCGTIFERTPANALRNLSCTNKLCKRKLDKRKKSSSQFKDQVKAVLGDDYTIVEDYKTSLTKIKVHHTLCNQTWQAYPTNLLKGHGCLHCFGRIQQSTESFSKRLYNLVGDEYTLVGEYIKSREKVTLYHKKCGKSYDITPDGFMQGGRCLCVANSRGEAKVEDFLINVKQTFKRQNTFTDCKHKNVLPFDFAVFNNLGGLVFLIEYDGKQHFEPIDFFGGQEGFESVQLRDKIKNQYCFDNDIPLLRIPYWDFDNIEEIVYEELKKYNLIDNLKIA